MRRRFVLLLPVAAAACGPLPPRPEAVTLPDSARAQFGFSDPARSAILSASFVFGQPGSVAGDPAAAAEALAQLEFLAVELATDQRWIGLDPLVVPQLAGGRAEARAAFGLDPAAPPQRALNALYATAAALRGGDRDAALAALASLTGPGRAEATLGRLAALPHLPQAAAATARARNGMRMMDQDNGRNRFRL